ncbi:hypothetical protein [uncultured Oscillibacter sp.]|nr:hypothetical protein [uncultured Oscillibacter sp.]
MSESVGKSVTRVDAYEKATGRARYMDDVPGHAAYLHSSMRIISHFL